MTQWSGAAEVLFGWSADEVIGRPVSRLWPAHREDADLADYERIVGDDITEFRAWQYHRDGSPFLAEVYVTPIVEGGEWQGTIALVRDAGTEHDLVRRVGNAERRFESAFAATSLPLAICALDSTVLEANDAYRALASQADPEPRGRILDLIEPEHRPPIAAALSSLATRPGRIEALEAPVTGLGGATLRLSVTSIDDGPDAPPLALVQVTDVTDPVPASAEPAVQVAVDPLTGAHNRAQLQPILDALGSGSDLSVLFVDLDRFTEVNRSRGHAAGDLLIETIGARIDAAVRDTDTIVRYTGDQFLVLCPGLADPDAATRLGDRLRASIAAPVEIDGGHVEATASIGIATTRIGDSSNLESVISQAEHAMRRAKAAGRNTTIV